MLFLKLVPKIRPKIGAADYLTTREKALPVARCTGNHAPLVVLALRKQRSLDSETSERDSELQHSTVPLSLPLVSRGVPRLWVPRADQSPNALSGSEFAGLHRHVRLIAFVLVDNFYKRFRQVFTHLCD